MFTKIYKIILAHKIISVIAVLAVIGGGYYWYSSSRNGTMVTKYIIEKATQGTIVTSVSESGQVESVSSIDVSPKVTETVTKVYVKVGDKVAAGQLLVQMDTTNEADAVKKAQISLQSAQLNSRELQEVSTSTLLQDQMSVTKAKQSLEIASSSFAEDYRDGFDTLSATTVDLQNVMTELKNFVEGNDLSQTQNNPDAYVNVMPNYLQASTTLYRDVVITTYTTAASSYQDMMTSYHAANRNDSHATLDALFSKSYNTLQSISALVRASYDFLNYIVNNYPKRAGLASLPAVTNTYQTALGTYLSTVNNHITSIGNVISGITNDGGIVTNDEMSLSLAEEALAELVAGPTETELLSQQLAVENAQTSLDDAETSLADCSVRAPIDGTISAVDAAVGQTVVSPAVSMVSNEKIAILTLNEEDVVNVAVGDKATLTFDAIDGLSLAGQVAEVSPIGTVSQGVVSYTAKISFSDTTKQVKSGMSVTADIATETHLDVVTIPSSAVQTMGSSTYVLVPSSDVSDADLAVSANGGMTIDSLKRVSVTVGLSDGTATEIISGLSIGDQVVVKTIKSTVSAISSLSTKKSGSILNILSGGGGTPPSGGGTPPSGGLSGGTTATGR